MDKILWLGQGGLLLEHQGLRVMIDPYLSDSVEKLQPQNRRRVKADPRFLTVTPDVLILTHDHLDHYDPETVCHFLTADSKVTVLSPRSVWPKVRSFGGAGNNYVQFDRQTQWSQGGLRFTAVRAVHSDPDAIGVLVDDGEKTYYITGDTLYSEAIFPELPPKIDWVFLPINGVGNNMNMTDAARFAARVGAKTVVPMHFGLFDDIDPRAFSCDGKVIPKFFEEMNV